MTDRLYVATKAPRPGFVKTRLGSSLGHESAAGLYRAFLKDLSRRLRGLPISTGWFVTPDDGWPEVVEVVGSGWAAPVAQGGGDWGARQDRLFRTAADRGEDRVVLIASDSPQVGIEAIAAAFAALDTHDLVLGPVFDGGYWLVGMRSYHSVLAGVQMSTTGVFEHLLSRASRDGLAVKLMRPTFDVDEPSDLQQLTVAAHSVNDMPATIEALRRLGTMMDATQA